MTSIRKVEGGGGVSEGVGSSDLAHVNDLTDLLFIFADEKWVGGQKIVLFCERHKCITTNMKSYFDKKECF